MTETEPAAETEESAYQTEETQYPTEGNVDDDAVAEAGLDDAFGQGGDSGGTASKDVTVRSDEHDVETMLIAEGGASLTIDFETIVDTGVSATFIREHGSGNTRLRAETKKLLSALMTDTRVPKNMALVQDFEFSQGSIIRAIAVAEAPDLVGPERAGRRIGKSATRRAARVRGVIPCLGVDVRGIDRQARAEAT